MRVVKVDTVKGEGAKITINRPEKRNAVNKAVTSQLADAIQEVKKIDGLKYVVLTGEGDKSFCAGGDLNELHGKLSAKEAYELLIPMMQVLFELATLPIPTIALLNGAARGGGCELATACDFRFARPQDKFGFIQANLGITPGWGGGALLYRKIRPELAFHWLVTGDMRSAEECQRAGWIHGLTKDPTIYLETFSPRSYQQMRSFKQQYLKSLDIKSLHKCMEEEVQTSASLWETDEHMAAVERFFHT